VISTKIWKIIFPKKKRKEKILKFNLLKNYIQKISTINSWWKKNPTKFVTKKNKKLLRRSTKHTCQPCYSLPLDYNALCK
jgi:hypothetical protein